MRRNRGEDKRKMQVRTHRNRIMILVRLVTSRCGTREMHSRLNENPGILIFLHGIRKEYGK